MKTEKVFEILGEGAGICIERKKNKSEEVFLYQHNEFDPTDEGLEVNEKGKYKSFEQPFELINNKYPWYILHIETVHKEFRGFVIDKLIKKLNEDLIKPENLDYSKISLNIA